MKRAAVVYLFLACLTSAISAGVLLVDKTNGPYTSIWAANRAAAPGDTVLVRGGVYDENIGIMNDGTASAYITYKNYPGEEVIINGAMPLTGWKKCASQTEALGNPNWQNIWYADVSRPVSTQKANLYEGENLLGLAQDPQPTDPFFDKSTDKFRLIPTNGLTLTTLKDAGYFTQSDPNYWVGVYIKILTGNNLVYTQKISAYNPSTNTVTFNSLPSVQIEYGKDKYAVANHPLLLKKAGQYVCDDDARRIYLWPLRESSLAGDITMTYKTNAFLVSRRYVRLEGFIIKRFYDNAIYAEGADGVILKDLEIYQGIARAHEWVIKFIGCSNCIIEGCHIHHNKHNRGMLVQNGSNNIVRNTVMDKNGGTGINYYGETGSKLEGNLVLNHRGQHANGLTCYNGNKNITITGCFVRDGHVALTYQQIAGMTCINNVFQSGGWATACWNASNTSSVTFYNNTIYTSGSDYAFRSQSGTISGLVFKNNICKGWPGKYGTCTNNLYIRVPYHNPSSLGSGEKLVDEAGVFRGAGEYDFRPASGSPAINMGTNVNVPTDITGYTRSAPDAGAFEYRTGETTRPTIASVSSPDSRTVVVTFSEAVDAKYAMVTTNYTLSDNMAVGRAVVSADGKTVTLTVTPLETGTYTLTVNHVIDGAGNVITKNSSKTFSATGTEIRNQKAEGRRQTGMDFLRRIGNPCHDVKALVDLGARVYTMEGKEMDASKVVDGMYVVKAGEVAVKLVIIKK